MRTLLAPIVRHAKKGEYHHALMTHAFALTTTFGGLIHFVLPKIHESYANTENAANARAHKGVLFFAPPTLT